MENYEQKYKQSLERAATCLNDSAINDVGKRHIEYIFPELKESEDERIRKTMAKFIELTQHIQNFDENYDRKVRVNVEHIDFYYNKHIVFVRRAIDVLESYDEITKLLEEQQQ